MLSFRHRTLFAAQARGRLECSRGFSRWLGFGLSLAVFVAILACPALAQNTGRVDGLVHDQSGAVVPGAAVSLRNEASGTELKGKTDATGYYSIDLVPPATYTLAVQVAGFKTYSRTELVVHPADRLNVPVAMELGQQVQMIEVTGQAAQLVTTDSGAKTDVIGASQIQNLATEGRNAMELLTLLPGVVNNGFNVTQGSSFDQGVGSFNINGLRNDQNDIRMDNAHMIDPGSNGGFIIEPNMDMIQEFSLKGSSFEADQGRSGLIIDTVTKSGGNKLHGEVYYYGRNAALNANDWSNNDAGLAKPGSKFNYPGFNIGGPVKLPHSDFNKSNDKMFFFVAMEWQRQLADPGTELATVPTQKMRTGDFSDLLNTKFCQTDSQGNVTGGRFLNMPCLVTDPKSASSLPGNMIPANEITQNGQIFLNIFPLPNFVDPGGRYNFAGRPLYAENRNEQTVRIDYNLTENTRAFVRLARNAEHHFYPYGLWSGENSGWTSNIPEPSPTLGIDSGQGVSVNLVRVINPTLTNEFQFNVQALNLPNRYQDPSKLSSKALGLSFKGFAFNGVAPRTDTVPQISDAWSYSGGNPAAGRWGEGDIGSGVFADKTEFEWLDNVTKVHGAHTLKFGASLDRTRNDQNGDGFQAVPEGGFVTDASWGSTTGNEFGDLLTEHVKNYGQASSDPDGLWRFWDLEWYGQDSWKATRRLTLNYGARFSWLQPWNETRGHVSTFDPTKYDPSKPTYILNGIVTAQAHQVPNSIYPNPNILSNLQPRLGFAFDVFGTGKTVLRGGFGTYVTRDQGNIAFFGADNIPFVYSASSGGPNGFTSLSQVETTDPFGALGNISLTADDLRDKKDPQTYEWNFTLSQNIGLKTTLETSYVGNVSRHLVNEHDLNPVPLGAMWKPGTQALSSTTTQGFRYYQPFGNLYSVDHGQTANYHSLQMTARRNVSHGLTLLASYTWSKTLGYATAFNNHIDPFDSRRDYGLLNYDRAHILNFSYIYQLPNPGSKYVPGNRWAHGALDDWQISGITHYASGPPLRVSISGLSCKVDRFEPANSPAQNLCGSNLFTGDARTWLGTDSNDVAIAPLVQFNPRWGVPSKGVKASWLNPFSLSLPNIGQFGTYEQPTFRGPGSNEWDMTLFKTFPLGEGRRLEFRFAGFDIFNRANLDNPQTTAAFNWQLPRGATSLSQGSAVVTNPGQFGFITDKHGHREMEVAIKIYF